MNIFDKLSAKAKNMKSSIIRELLVHINDPGMISLGGGAPDPETFPRDNLSEIASDIIRDEYKASLQYGLTEGDVELKKQYIRHLEKHEGIKGVDTDNFLITTGSQEALYLIGLVFGDEDSICAVSAPTYLGAVSAFRLSGAKFIGLPLKENGMDLGLLESHLENLKVNNQIHRFKFVYVIPNYMNPTGLSEPVENRKKLAELAEKYDFMIVEDDPYNAVRFEGEKLPSVYSMVPHRTLLLNTFSKVLSPGMRIGIILGDKVAIRRLVIAKQAIMLCSSSVSQRIAARFMEKYDLIDKIQDTIKLYAGKRDTMLKALEEIFGDMDDVEWTHPKGGLFLWMKLPKEVDTSEMLDLALKNKVLYIPGDSFYFDNPERNTIRLCFSLPSHENIYEGIRRLRKTVDIYLEEKASSSENRVLAVSSR